MVANDFLTAKLPTEWGNIVREGRDGYLKLDYSATTSMLWSALQHALKEIDELKKEVKKIKADAKGKGK